MDDNLFAELKESLVQAKDIRSGRLEARRESPRVLRRLHFLREWSHEQEQQVFP